MEGPGRGPDLPVCGERLGQTAAVTASAAAWTIMSVTAPGWEMYRVTTCHLDCDSTGAFCHGPLRRRRDHPVVGGD